MQLIIEELEWSLERADYDIEIAQKRVDSKSRWLADYQEELEKATEELTHRINRKEELQQALEVLRSHVEEELT